MPTTVDKWILYKHTSDINRLKEVALTIKHGFGTNLDKAQRIKLATLFTKAGLYKSRNPEKITLDSINHRINTLEFFMFGHEYRDGKQKKFMFGPLGNLFVKHIKNGEKLTKIFTSMLFGIQFQHYANGTPAQFQLYPFRLIFSLLLEKKLDYKLYHDEYAYLIAFVDKINKKSYKELIDNILLFRSKSPKEKIELFKKDQHTYVNCVYEWQYYMLRTLNSFKIIDVNKGKKLLDLYHPKKPKSKSDPTKRILRDGYISINDSVRPFVENMLKSYPYSAKPISLDDPCRLQIDAVKEIYSFCPNLLLQEIGESLNSAETKMLELPRLIEAYSKNLNGKTSDLFELILEDAFNMFYNVKANHIGGAGNTDVECLYTKKPVPKKFAVEAKSTNDKLLKISAGRLKKHRKKIGGEYTIIITPQYAPAVMDDIDQQPIVVILSHTFSEYLYNHIYNKTRNIDYASFDKIIVNHFGEDVSKLISDLTVSKFASL